MELVLETIRRLVHAIKSHVDFLQFYIVPIVDLIEQPPSVSLHGRVFPLLVSVDDVSLTIEVIKRPHDHLAAPYEPVSTWAVSWIIEKTHMKPPLKRSVDKMCVA